MTKRPALPSRLQQLCLGRLFVNQFVKSLMLMIIIGGWQPPKQMALYKPVVL